MIKSRCPTLEVVALLVEGRIGRSARARVLRHAADCVSCRRQLAIASLAPIGPFRAWMEEAISSERTTAAAGLFACVLLLWMIWPGSSVPETSKPLSSSRHLRSTSPPRDVARAPAPESRGDLPRVAGPEPEARVLSEPSPKTTDPKPAPADLEHALTWAPQRASEPGDPRRLDSLVEKTTSAPAPVLPAAPASARLPDPVESVERLAILDPFGGLALEGVGGRSAVLGSGVIPVDVRLTAPARTSGFRLNDGTKVQLTPGSAIFVFQNVTRHCPGLALLQGSLLVESSHPQSLFLRRNDTSGLIEGLDGPVYLGAGSRADALTVMPMGSKGLTWTKTGQAALDLGATDVLGLEGGSQEVSPRAARARISLARFVAWPEPSTLFFSTFETGVQGMELPGVVQGLSKDGYVAAVTSSKGRKTIELAMPASMQTLPADATIRLRLRTTASRIQVGLGSNPSRTTPHPVTQRSRSETVWMSMSFPIASLDQDGLRDRGERGGRRSPRGNLTFTVEAPARVAAEEMVFDIDEIEIVKT